MSKKIIMIGNGGHASVLTEILIAQGEEIIGFTAPTVEENQFSLNYLGNDDEILNYSPANIELVLGLGMVKPSTIREKIFHSFSEKGYRFKTLIHPSAIIAPSVQIGDGVQIMAGVIIQTNTEIADNTIINTAAIVDHDCKIEQHVHLAPGTVLSGCVHIGKGTHVGTGAKAIQGIAIGANCLIGAGAVVVKDIADEVMAIGVPAKKSSTQSNKK